jgi:SAM-dependent methyltransferase
MSHTHAGPAHPSPEAGTGPESVREFWDEFYRSRGTIWSGNPNAVLVDVVQAEVAAGRGPGAALDLGCGEGGDAAWLAGQGWRVTAVDVAEPAVERTTELAARRGVADRVHAVRLDLSEGLPEGPFQLVSAQFLQSPVELPRARVLREAAELLAPGGLLLVVDHGAAPPWSNHHDAEFPTTEEVFAELELDPARWTAELLTTRTRTATGPEGETGELLDNVLAIRLVSAE